jgi:hypothetical protein
MMAALKEARVAAGISGRALSLKLRKPYNYASKMETDAIGADPVEFARRVVELSGPRRRRKS